MFNEKEKCTFIFSIKTKKPIPANYEMQQITSNTGNVSDNSFKQTCEGTV